MGLTKDRRDRLFRKGKPLVRPFDPVNDMWVLWAAYDLGSFKKMKQGLTKPEFTELVMLFVSGKSSCLVIEDRTKHFKNGKGPVAFVTIDNFGWRIEPQVDFFMWASPRMILRCSVAFVQMLRYSKDVGVCVMRGTKNTHSLLMASQKYFNVSSTDPETNEVKGGNFPLHRVGYIPHGSPNGDEYIFSINGLKKA